MPSIKGLSCLAVATCAVVTLQGCGGGTSGTTAQPPTTTRSTTTKTTTTTLPPRTAPWTPEEAVEKLNAMYMAFDENDANSQLGVTMSWAAQNGAFTDNLFCAAQNDNLPHDTGCYEGQADCRMSASIFNHKMIVDENKPAAGFGRDVAYVFNQTMVETQLGKCAFIYDGASGNNYNGGCGTGAPTNDCDDQSCAFYNKCPEGGAHTCARHDKELNNWLCQCSGDWCSAKYGSFTPPTRKDDPICYYELPAFITDEVSSTNHLRDMLHQRVIAQGRHNDMQEEWNEVVIDEKLLIPQIMQDPGITVVAFLFKQDGSERDGIARQEAIAMRDGYQQWAKMSGVGDIPVLAMDFRTDITKQGPFATMSAMDTVAI